MSRFIQTDRVAVRDGEDTIYVRRKMDIGTVARIDGATRRMGGTEHAAGVALLMYNVVAWEGPGFVDDKGKPIPCTPEQVEQLPPDDPLMALAIEKIAELMQPPEDAPGPLASTTSTVPAPTVDAVEHQANGQPMSVLP
jgi:hypothetical protein